MYHKDDVRRRGSIEKVAVASSSGSSDEGSDDSDDEYYGAGFAPRSFALVVGSSCRGGMDMPNPYACLDSVESESSVSSDDGRSSNGSDEESTIAPFAPVAQGSCDEEIMPMSTSTSTSPSSKRKFKLSDENIHTIHPNSHSDVDSDSDVATSIHSARTPSSRPTKRQRAKISHGERWDMMYNALCRYVQVKRDDNEDGVWNGTVPFRYVTDDEPPLKLGYWVNKQRANYKKNKMSNDRLAKLEEVGLKWAICSKYRQTMHSNSHSDVAKSSHGAYRPMPQFLRIPSSRPTKRQRAKISHDERWDMMFNALCRYVQAKRDDNEDGEWNGTVPFRYVTDDEPPLKLGFWVNKQRANYKKNKMSNDRLAKLEEVGLKWAICTKYK